MSALHRRKPVSKISVELARTVWVARLPKTEQLTPAIIEVQRVWDHGRHIRQRMAHGQTTAARRISVGIRQRLQRRLRTLHKRKPISSLSAERFNSVSETPYRVRFETRVPQRMRIAMTVVPAHVRWMCLWVATVISAPQVIQRGVQRLPRKPVTLRKRALIRRSSVECGVTKWGRLPCIRAMRIAI